MSCIKKCLSLSLALLLLSGFTAFADSLCHSEHNAYFKCAHTKQKVDRTKVCPCGCNKKKRAQARIVSADDTCESDDVVAHIPQFEKLSSVATFLVSLKPVLLKTVISWPAVSMPVVVKNTISPPG